MIHGFQLRTLRVTGKDRIPAEVSFGPGLNVISGASNTGKSYILQCIDFMMGRTDRPKPIKESAGYESVFLELEDHTGQIHELERSLSGHAFRHRIVGRETSEEVLAERHASANKKTISALLLGLSNAWGRKILSNQSSGKTRTLSFRDLARLMLVDEMRIISDESPVLSGQYITRTEEIATFKLLLTGVDDGSIVAQESKSESRGRKKAQLELLDRLIAEIEREIRQLDQEPASAEDRRRRLEDAIFSRAEELTATREEIAKLEKLRREAWEEAKKLERREAATEELRHRFTILEEHYNSDLARLQAIIEVDHYFSQLQQVRCPLCGATNDQHNPSAHEEQDSDQLESIRLSCSAEIRKIKSLLRDLVGTTVQLDAELSVLRKRYLEQNSLFKSATDEVMTRLNPAANRYQLELAEVIRTRDSLAHIEMLQAKLTDLKAERDSIASTTWKPAAKTADLDVIFPQATDSFSLKVQEILETWNYPGLTRVTFSDRKVDLIISGKERASEGKGFRAIAYAAFIIGLLEYCAEAEEELPHPGVVVLDSPLVTYKRRDTEPGEEIPEDVTVAFYQALATTTQKRQVIVLENNDPPEGLHNRIHYTHFSRSASGRYGFFPVSKS